jgi:hypothetical protein
VPTVNVFQTRTATSCQQAALPIAPDR